MSNPNPVRQPLTPGRKKGARNKRSYVVEALQKHYEEEAAAKGDGEPVDGQACFWMAEAKMAAAGDAQARSTIAKKLEPDLKQMDLTADVDVGRKHLTTSELRERVVTTIAAGASGDAGIAALIANLGAGGGTTAGGDPEQG